MIHYVSLNECYVNFVQNDDFFVCFKCIQKKRLILFAQQLFHMESHKSSQLSTKPSLDFHKLYYPIKKASNHSIPTIRSKSMTSVLMSPQNNTQQPDSGSSFTRPRKQARKYNSTLEPSSQKQRIMKKYRQKILKSTLPPNHCTFKHALSPLTSSQQHLQNLPLTSLTSLQHLSTTNLTLKQSLQTYKQQKHKINTLLQSPKVTEQEKMTFLLEKKGEVRQEVEREMREVFERYFRKEYEARFGKGEVGYQEFQKRLGRVLGVVQGRVFG